MKIVFDGFLGIVLDSKFREQLLSGSYLLCCTVLPETENLLQTCLLLSDSKTDRLNVKPCLLVVHDIPSDILAEDSGIPESVQIVIRYLESQTKVITVIIQGIG